MQISILSGIYTNEDSDFRTFFPVNLVPVPGSNGISNGYLKPADGIVEFGIGPGVDRGGINWNGVCYRVMGDKLVKIESTGDVVIIGDVGGTDQVSLDYSFDRLVIASGGNLYYWDGAVLAQVTDLNLGTVLDVVWVDGYFMTTDGEHLVITELNDPFVVDPFKYGSAEVDPDPIVGVTKVRNEIHAIGRYTIEVFQNVGGATFPFSRINGAQIQKGAIGTHASHVFLDTLAFLGSGRGESPSVYLGGSATTIRIATREIDKILLGYTEKELSRSVVESRVDSGHQHLLIHLIDKTLVYDAKSSSSFTRPVWFILSSSLISGEYRGKNLVWCYDKWLCGDTFTSNHGVLVETSSDIYGDVIRWEFGTPIIYNEGNSVIIHKLELVSLTGRVVLGDNPLICTEYSIDGVNWSQKKYIKSGKIGNRTIRLVWFRQGFFRNWRIQRFSGTSVSRISIARLEVHIEALNG